MIIGRHLVKLQAIVCPVQTLGCNVPLDSFVDFGTVYIVCLLNFLPYSLTLLPYVYACMRIGQLTFPGQRL